MPSKTPTSPFGPAFTSAINRGTPCWTAVTNIASRCNKTPSVVFNSLCKAGLCYRQKFNGTWVYWPCNMPKKCTGKCIKTCQTNMWQSFVEWCLASGCCTPAQMHKHCSSQANFMKWCNKFWSKQFKTGTKTGSKSKPKSKIKSKSKSKGKSKSKSMPHSYKFPTLKSRPGSSTRRYRKVA